MLVIRLSYFIEIYNLLLDIYYRGRRARSLDIIIYILVKVNFVTTILFLDVLIIFNNVFYKRLIYNSKNRRVSMNTIEYIISFLKSRSIKLRLLD